MKTAIVTLGRLFVITAAAPLFAQPAAPQFDVASVKPTKNPGASMRSVRALPGARLTATNATLRMLIINAYAIQPGQLAGGPEWMDSSGFDIDAKGDAGANREQVFLMLRSLLAERFQLRYHQESRQLPVYLLTVAKKGAHLPTPTEGGCQAADPNAPPAGRGAVRGPLPTPCGMPRISMMASGISLSGGKVTMPELVRVLRMVMGRPVMDKTGIAAPFDLQLTFARDEYTAGLPRSMAPAKAEGGDAPLSSEPDSGPPSILSAIQEQLGLKLESGKGPVEVMVIDRAEPPSAN